jgi:hypothetical protein
MKLTVTTITLIFIASLIFMYLLSQSGPIHNAGTLNADDYEGDGSYDETELSSSDTDKMTSKNSAARTYKSTNYYTGTRGGASQSGLDVYFDQSSSDSDSEVNGIDSGISPPASEATNGNFEGGNGLGNQFASYTGTGTTSSSEETMFNAEELLPSSSTNSYFDTYDNIKVSNTQLINAYRPIGTNTVMGSLRNPTWDLRGEPANQKRNVGPWNNSTIQPNIYKTGVCN